MEWKAALTFEKTEDFTTYISMISLFNWHSIIITDDEQKVAKVRLSMSLRDCQWQMAFLELW